MWRDEKTEYLRRNRDYSRLLDIDDGEAQTPRRQNRGRSKDRQIDADNGNVSPDRQEYLDRRRRLKELERQKLTKGKNGVYNSVRRDEVSKGGEQNRDRGSSRIGGGVVFSNEKKKLPYDRSFGSFFGPSEPVVAKRIIEEARAREEAEIVAARDAAKAKVEAEQRKKVASSSAGKASRDRRPPKPPKPVDKATEKTRKLKEARDYSFLFDDSPLPDPKIAGRERPSSSNQGVRRHDSASVLANNHSPRKLPSERPKTTPESRRPGGSATASRPLQSQSKSLPLSRSLARQGGHDQRSDKSAMRNMPIVRTSAKPLTSKVSSAGPGRPDPKGDTNRTKIEVTKKVVAGSTASNVNKSISADRRPQPSPALDRRNSLTLDRDRNQVTDKHRTLPSDRRPTRQPDRLPPRAAETRPAPSTNRHQTQSTGTRPAQVKERGPVGTKASERGAVLSQGVKKGAPTSETYRAAANRGETKSQVSDSQKLERKPVPKVASRPALSDYNRGRHSDDRWQGEARHKRARSLSEESEERPARRNKLPNVRVNSIRFQPRARSPSEEEDDSFIDDDDDPANVSSMIHSIMGYNPNKYRGNDDFDDRAMEVGFRTIQAEERRSAREARLEDERELAMIEAEEREERLRKAKKKRKQTER
ncbi:unnamed protein product [Calypogeia fissa]